MKDSMGLIPALSIVLVFIVVISGYLAFTINYSKAFKAKSRIINLIQQHDNDVEKAISDISKYLKQINYKSTDKLMEKGCNQSEGWITKNTSQDGWCYKIITTADDSNNEDKKSGKGSEKKYVKIRTFISIDIPIINNIFAGLNVFYVDGSTRATNYVVN